MGIRHSIRPMLAALAVSLFAGSAAADQIKAPTGVVELFTSQGCSSCPPADAVLGNLARKGDVVALAYHVDYWDYLGWRDTLASPDNTARQYDYMHAFGSRSVYTPQAVINGRTHVNGASGAAIDRTLSNFADTGEGLTVPVTVKHGDGSFVVEAGKGKGGKQKAYVVLVYFDPATPIVIERGENKGRTVTYWNAVTDIQTAGMWHGDVMRFELPASEIAKKGGGGCAVLLQSVDEDGRPGPILGAAVIDGT